MSTVFCSTTTPRSLSFCFFFFNDTATTEIYTLSLHDTLPISRGVRLLAIALGLSLLGGFGGLSVAATLLLVPTSTRTSRRSEEHTSELQSRLHLVCRLLLEKKKTSTRDMTRMR